MLRLRPVAEILDIWLADRVAVSTTVMPVAEAIGLTLAAPILMPGPLPSRGMAMADGVAVVAAETIGASPYAPVMLSMARAVSAGDAVPAPFDAVVTGGGVEGLLATYQAAPGETLRRVGEDAAAGTELAAVGTQLTPRAAILADAAGVALASVRRPVISLYSEEARAEGVAGFLTRLLRALGAEVRLSPLGTPVPSNAADAVIFIGGAAIGAADPALAAARATAGWRDIARPAARRVEDAVAGTLEGHPALVMPARFDACLVAGLVLLQPLLDRLSGRSADRMATRPLVRKITSPVGLTELVLLAEDAASGDWLPMSINALGMVAATHAAILPPGSEGAGAGDLLSALALPSGF